MKCDTANKKEEEKNDSQHRAIKSKFFIIFIFFSLTIKNNENLAKLLVA